MLESKQTELIYEISWLSNTEVGIAKNHKISDVVSESSNDCHKIVIDTNVYEPVTVMNN